MNAALLAVLTFTLFALGYRFYSGFLSEKIFGLAADEPVPARELEDGIDYVPTGKHILWATTTPRLQALRRSSGPRSR